MAVCECPFGEDVRTCEHLFPRSANGTATLLSTGTIGAQRSNCGAWRFTSGLRMRFVALGSDALIRRGTYGAHLAGLSAWAGERSQPQGGSHAFPAFRLCRIYRICSVGGAGRLFVVGGTGCAKLRPARASRRPVGAQYLELRRADPARRDRRRRRGVRGEDYVFGGLDKTLSPYGKTQIYDPVANQWSTGASMPTPRWDLGAAAPHLSGKTLIYTVGGNSSEKTASSAVEAYDPQANSWSKQASLPFANAPAVAVAVGQLFAIGGYSRASGPLGAVYRYHPKTNQWFKHDSMLVARSNPAIGVVPNRSGEAIVVVGGIANSGYTADNEKFAHNNNRYWTEEPPAPIAVAYPCSSGIRIRSGGPLFIAGGEGSGGVTGATESFRLEFREWATLASMPQPLAGAASATYGGKLYCIGGASAGYPKNSTTIYNNVQIYTP